MIGGVNCDVGQHAVRNEDGESVSKLMASSFKRAGVGDGDLLG